MRSGSRRPAFYGEIPPMRWGIPDDDGGYFYCITYNGVWQNGQMRSDSSKLTTKKMRKLIENNAVTCYANHADYYW